MVEVTDLIGIQEIILMIIAIVLLIFIIILFIAQSKIKKKLYLKEEVHKQDSSINKEFELIKNSSEKPEIRIERLNKFAKKFLTSIFGLSENIDYNELAKIFNKKKKKKISEFCTDMLNLLYSGKNIENKKVNDMVIKMQIILREEYLKMNEAKKFENKISLNEKSIPSYTSPNIESEKRNMLPKIKESKGISNSAGTKNLTGKKQSLKPNINILSLPNKNNIENSYKELQDVFEKRYNQAEKLGNKEMIEKLNTYRSFIIRKMVEYLERNRLKEFRKAIKEGFRLLGS